MSTSEFARFVLQRQVSLLFRNVWLGQAVSVINACLLAWVAYPVLDGGLLAAWLVLALCLAGLRQAQAVAYRRLDETSRETDAASWLHRARLGVLASTAVWSLGALLFMLAGDTPVKLFTAFVMAGMTAGAVPVLAADRISFRLYAWPLVLAVTVGSLGNDPLHIAFSFMSVLFLLAVTRSADYFHDALHDSFRLEFDKDQLVADLREAKRRSELSDRAKTEFLANVSHELRTPMNGIIGMAELLSLEPLTAEQQEMLNPLRESADQLLELINHMLELSALEAGHIAVVPTPFSPAALKESVHERFAPLAARKHLELTIADTAALPHLVVADLNKLQRVLGHLVGNAIKFTERGHISVAIACDGHTLSLSVTDSGPGITADKLAELSGGLFVQGDGSVARRHGGTGIGIPITRKLLDLMGGKLEIDSTPGQGSCFSFSVPITLCPDSSDPAGPAPA